MSRCVGTEWIALRRVPVQLLKGRGDVLTGPHVTRELKARIRVSASELRREGCSIRKTIANDLTAFIIFY